MANSTEVGMKSPLHARQTSDYFGPSVSARPLTESVTSPSVATPSGNRGVPTNSSAPLDVATSVDIYSRQHSNVTSPGLFDYGNSPGSANHPFGLP
ncbi:uncharacterized protein RAG0_07700 [Rhynchosporium agropyri]|uniref:Uncharacterized protein n=1 Tax=Rhynchosporium agropyri TaxID=914238 RepID=A0A1E1KQZ6_9HELO|nr:uncharacterized protein RAG0_07700 [Rhynchosporium agropyri]